jgi:hypothetical protein
VYIPSGVIFGRIIFGHNNGPFAPRPAGKFQPTGFLYLLLVVLVRFSGLKCPLWHLEKGQVEMRTGQTKDKGAYSIRLIRLDIRAKAAKISFDLLRVQDEYRETHWI